jgi:hypothetical protein
VAGDCRIDIMLSLGLRFVVNMYRRRRTPCLKVFGCTKYSGRAQRCLERHREKEKGKNAAAKHTHHGSLAENARDRPDGGKLMRSQQRLISRRARRQPNRLLRRSPSPTATCGRRPALHLPRLRRLAPRKRRRGTRCIFIAETQSRGCHADGTSPHGGAARTCVRHFRNRGLRARHGPRWALVVFAAAQTPPTRAPTFP